MTIDTTFLVQAACGGDRQAFGKLTERMTPLLVGVLGPRVGRDDLEDLLQETFMIAWRSLGGLRDPRTFRGWIVRLASGIATRWGERQVIERDALPKLAVSEVVEPAADSGWSDPVLHALGDLDPEVRAILLLRYCDERSTKEVARTMELPPDVVRKRVSRARSQLLERLKPTED